MSENLNLVSSIYAEWERSEFNPEAEVGTPRHRVRGPRRSEPSTRMGQASAPGIEPFLNLWEELRFEAEEYRELDDGSVFVLGRMRGRGKGSGVEVDDDRKVTRLALYWDRDRALADLALEG